jgi:CBS-domain-containing membrane protein
MGCLFAIGLAAFLGHRFGVPLLVAPFAASAYLLYGEPDNPYSQPRNVLGGYLICGVLGLGFFHLWGVSSWTHAGAVAAALIAMEGMRVLHPPAAGVALLPLLGGDHSPWSLVVPLLAGPLLLIAVACVVNNMVPGRRYPHFC